VSSAPAASAASRRFPVRALQLARAAFAALAALMITFSPDHSAAVGLSVFSGFAILTAAVFAASVWLTYPQGERAPSVLLGVISLLAGMVTGIGVWRVDAMFFGAVIAWAVLSGIVELIAGVRARRRARAPQERSEARDAVVIGAAGLALAVALALVPAGYRLDYVIEEAGTFELTAITIGVGIFGFYTAIVAVYLGIAGFSPRREAPQGAEAVAQEDMA